MAVVPVRYAPTSSTDTVTYVTTVYPRTWRFSMEDLLKHATPPKERTKWTWIKDDL